MQLQNLTEVGVAVRNLAETTQLLVKILGGQVGPIYEVPTFGMRFCMVSLGGVDFELMEPTDEKGLIANFIDRHGEGLHHITFAVSNIEELIDSMKASGCQIINEKPQEIKGLKAVFIHPKSFSGILFEFVEYPKDWTGWQK